MLATVNKVTIVGEVGQEPETGMSPGSSEAVALLVILTDAAGSGTHAGARKAMPESHRVVLLGTLAQVVAATVQRGATVFVEGRLTTRRYMAHDGQVVAIAEVVAERFSVIGGGKTLLAASVPVDDASAQSPWEAGVASANGARTHKATFPKFACRAVCAAAVSRAHRPGALTGRRR